MAASIIPAFANVAANTTDAVIVAAVPNKCIRVKQYRFICGSSATNTTFNSMNSPNAGTPIDCLNQNASNGGAVCPYSEYGWIFTNTGEALTVTTGSGSTVGVLVGYDLI